VTELSPESSVNVLAKFYAAARRKWNLLIRTGGEQRLSDFLFVGMRFRRIGFYAKRWPDSLPQDLEAAVLEFGKRSARAARCRMLSRVSLVEFVRRSY